MCGIVGIAGVMPVNQSIYDALTVLQHRGQDAAGIITIDANNCFRLRKSKRNGERYFEARHMQRLQGNMGIGHVRYPTAGSSSASKLNLLRQLTVWHYACPQWQPDQCA